MLAILATLIPVFGIIFLGLLTERLRFMPTEMALCLNQFVYWIGLPAMLFYQLARMETGTVDSGLIWGILGSGLLVYLLAHGLYSHGFRKHRSESTMFALLASFPNSAFMGLPIVFLLLPGEELATLVASLSAVLGTVILLLADGKLELKSHKGESKLRAMSSLFRSLFHNPLLLSSAAGALLSFFHIPVPGPILSMASMLGSTSAPCALFCMGMILSIQMTSSQGFIKGWVKRQLAVHICKLIVLPAVTWACLSFFGVKGQALAVSIIVSGMPTGVAAYIIAEKYQVAIQDASLGIIVNTGLSALTIPLTIFIVQWAGLLCS